MSAYGEVGSLSDLLVHPGNGHTVEGASVEAITGDLWSAALRWSPAAVPLVCAGITTYAPLRRWGAGPGEKVAIVGPCGLGHMVVEIAHALGAEVAVPSHR